MVSNHIISVATTVVTKALLFPLLFKFECICHGNPFLNTCLLPHLNLLLPHVANGDRVGQACLDYYNFEHHLLKLLVK